MLYDPYKFTYASRRQVVYGRNGAVCSSQPLAAQAGLEMLKKGGNAVDAALAAAITLTVVEPVANGVGSDCFSLIWDGSRLHGLNASGPAPMAADPSALRRAGHAEMPQKGWMPVDVPGTPAGWAAMHRRFGRLPFADLFAPAITHARNGHPVTAIIARSWKKTYDAYTALQGGETFSGWFDTFAPKDRAPGPGEMWGSEELARTLERLAATGCEDLYVGQLAERIDAASRAQGGWLRKEDLAAYQPEWVTPLSIPYKGYEVWELPPNGHGLVALMALNMLRNDRFNGRDDPETLHRQIEAMKLAFADGQRYITDPRYMSVTPEQLLRTHYADARRALIGETALFPEPGDPASGGTVYLCAADGEGNMVSFIQSNYTGFGSGVVVPGTGIALNNRGANFSLDAEHDNCLAPGKKPYHTIIPGFLTQNGKAVGPFGVMGGFMQPQGHVQVVTNTVDFMMNPQDTLDAPRWQWVGGMDIQLENFFPGEAVEGLIRRGHRVSVLDDPTSFGRGQIIWRDEHGVLAAATEPRADGTVAIW